ncbi:hypothetical protein LTR86_000316 [Recurvomyces mirabilis]|nr:hypothetical protein LTR86_000316 [Recurvomyces mirabilis]
MHRMNKKQELRRNFRFLSIFGYSLILGNGWVYSSTGAIAPLTNGGTAGGIWIYLIVIIGMCFSTLSMAEMASMAPTAGGQYHWVSEFAPREHERFLSYLTGWLCKQVLGWQTGLCATAYGAALALQAMIAINHADYSVPQWQGCVLTIAIVLITIFFSNFTMKRTWLFHADSYTDTVFLRRLPLFEGVMLAIHVMGFFAIFIIMWVMGDKSPTKQVWTEFADPSGWGSYGVATLVGSLGASGALLGSDSAAHLAEELKDAAWVLPRSMVATAAVNYSLTFIMVVTFMTVNGGDLDQLLGTSYAQPYVQILYNVTQSKAGGTGYQIYCLSHRLLFANTTLRLTFIIFILTMFGTVNQVTTASRQLWSFARDRGLPFSSYLSHVRPGWDVPLNAITVTLVFALIISFIILGSPVAVFTLSSISVSDLYSSYIICVGRVAWRRIKGQPLLPSRFSLGKAGLAINLIALAFLSVQWIFLFFPTAPHPTAPNFNWTCLVFGVAVVWSLAYYYLWGKKEYQGPVEYVRKGE